MSEKKADPIHESDVVLVEVSQDVYLAMSDNPSFEVPLADSESSPGIKANSPRSDSVRSPQ